MALYTVVSEGYEVSVYGSLSSVCDSVVGYGLVLTKNADDDAASATSNEIAKVLRKEGNVRLFELGKRDWTFKVEKHNKAM